MKTLTLTLAISAALASPLADAHGNKHQGGIQTDSSNAVRSAFDIVHAKVSAKGNVATFHMGVKGAAGGAKPALNGKLGGAEAYAYVWPTSINAYEVGFDKDAGILALAVASHPDFDDTPLFDENNDNDTGNDGGVWHSH